mmetsp:Transcript_98084/g.211527  ORF Transcript_98084/g.211527 Transcript_98084/m.211527 type:complete len:96 (+) Transcript_98084:1328-1615(+)
MSDLDLVKFELARGFKHTGNTEALNQSNVRMEMEVEVLGVGPDFILNLFLINFEDDTKFGWRIVFDYNPLEFEFEKSFIHMNVLINNLRYEYKVN